jgi:hypothetical protein
MEDKILVNPITIPFTRQLIDKVINELRPMTKFMNEPNEELISEEQTKLRKHFGTKYMPNCFGIGMMLIEDLTNKTSWTDFFPQENQVGTVTQRIFNTYELNQDVKQTHNLKCICGHPICADNSFWYHNPSSPIYLLVGQDCAVKYQLATHKDILKLRKEKRQKQKENCERIEREKLIKEQERNMELRKQKMCREKFISIMNKYRKYHTQMVMKKITNITFNKHVCITCHRKCYTISNYFMCKTCKLIFDKS